MNNQAWSDALASSSARLTDLVAEMSSDELGTASYANGWTIAAVLSHLGSAAEICSALVRRGLDGDYSAPRPDESIAVWDRWNAMSAERQRDEWVIADLRHRELLASVDTDEARVPYFAGLLDITDYMGYRLSEQSIHGWDVAVALDTRSRVPADEVDLLWRRIDLVATRFRSPEVLARLGPGQMAITFTDRGRPACLDLSSELHVLACEPATPTSTLRAPAEVLLRLIYGRTRPDDDVSTTGDITRADLQALFPGF